MEEIMNDNKVFIYVDKDDGVIRVYSNEIDCAREFLRKDYSARKLWERTAEEYAEQMAGAHSATWGTNY
jgi:hypothetical protein